jgi:ATP-dependent Clp protease ATP-binding subunit ClpB
MCRPERARLHKIKETKRKLEEAKHELEVAQWQGRYDAASKLRYSVIPELESQLPKDHDGESSSHDDGLSAHDGLSFLHERVTSSDIARVVARATGIPVQSLLKGEREKLTHV